MPAASISVRNFDDKSSAVPLKLESNQIYLHREFEDAVQMIAAVQCKASHLVTRNVRDFQPALISVVQPVELIALV